VVHGGNYIGPDKQGTSWGCFTVPNEVAPKLIGLTQNGTIIHAYAPDQKSLGNFSKQLTPQGSQQLANATGQQPIGIRNHNPGNIKDPKTGKFKVFGSPEEGLQAMDGLIDRYGATGRNTPTKFIKGNGKQGGWSATDQNEYIGNISKKLGIGPDDEINFNDPQTKAKLRDAIIRQENGSNPYDQPTMQTASNSRFEGNPMIPMDRAPVQNIPAFNGSKPVRDLSPQEIGAIMRNLHGENQQAPSSPMIANAAGVNWGLLQNIMQQRGTA
jgi:hypothetical protein